MKPWFYPELEKQALFSEGYIARQSSHSRGSAIDLTLLDMRTGKELDMGSPFDLFSRVSHPDYRGITDEQYENRMMLQRAMLRNGFLVAFLSEKRAVSGHLFCLSRLGGVFEKIGPVCASEGISRRTERARKNN